MAEIKVKTLKSKLDNYLTSLNFIVTFPLIAACLTLSRIATLCSYLMGVKTKIPWKRTLHCPAKTIFREGLQNFQYQASLGLKAAITELLKLLDSAHHFIFSKNGG